ncbi:MAG: type II secretion system F family protein [Nanoarchaeota archaeon]
MLTPLALVYTILNSRTLVEFIGNFVISLILAFIPYFIALIKINSIISNWNKYYLVFLRELYSNASSGLSLIQAVDILSKKDYKLLTPYIKKLNAWLSWSVPFPKAFQRFTELLKESYFVQKANGIILESYKIGGDIISILKTLSDSLYTIKKLDEERRSSLMGQAFTMGFIFLILIVVVLILKSVLIPILSQIKMSGMIKTSGEITKSSFFKNLFASLLYIQAIIIGLMIGVILNGTYNSGMKFAIAFFTIAFIVNVFFILPVDIKLDLMVFTKFANPGDPVKFSLNAYIDGKPYSGNSYLVLETINGQKVLEKKYPVKNGLLDSEIILPSNLKEDVNLYAYIIYDGKKYYSNKAEIIIFKD